MRSQNLKFMISGFYINKLLKINTITKFCRTRKAGRSLHHGFMCICILCCVCFSRESSQLLPFTRSLFLSSLYLSLSSCFTASTRLFSSTYTTTYFVCHSVYFYFVAYNYMSISSHVKQQFFWAVVVPNHICHALLQLPTSSFLAFFSILQQ